MFSPRNWVEWTTGVNDSHEYLLQYGTFVSGLHFFCVVVPKGKNIMMACKVLNMEC